MTCIVFAKCSEGLLTVADGRVTADGTIWTDVDKKVQVNQHNVACGGAGDSAACAEADSFFYECAELTSKGAAYALARHFLALVKQDQKIGDGVWLFGDPATGSSLYVVDSQGAVVDLGERVGAIGAGADYALGALSHLRGRDLSLYDLVTAVDFAATRRCDVGPVYWAQVLSRI